LVTKPQGASDSAEISATAVETPEPKAATNFLKRDVIANLVVVALILMTMEVWSWFTPSYIMPPVGQSAKYTVTILGEDYFHILITISRLILAVGFSLVVGSLIGAVMGMIKPIGPFVKSIVVIDTGVPALSWMLFAVFWFKEPEVRVFFILVMILIPFYALNVYDAIRALSTDLIEMVETFRPNRWQVLRLLILPHVVPYILMTTKSIIGYATRMTVFAELVSVSTGMGARMGLAQNNFEMDGVIAWTVLLVILNLSVQALVALAEKSLLKWRPEVSVR
jgi:NitT/TauT family transport system permease protein